MTQLSRLDNNSDWFESVIRSARRDSFRRGSNLQQISKSRHNDIDLKNNEDAISNLPLLLHAVTYASHAGRDDRFCSKF